MMRDYQTEFLTASDPEATLFQHVGEFVGSARDLAPFWEPGSPFQILLAGYSGAGNVGSEMRTHEIVRQLRFLLGEDNVGFTALSVGVRLPDDVLPGVRCQHLSERYIAEVVATSAATHHGVVACEGSMFKSTFANVLSGVMAGALAIATRTRKLSVGYGAEVGRMDPMLEAFTRQHVGDAVVLCRNAASLTAAQSLGLDARAGADTAWTFEAASSDRAGRLLRDLGWNGADPLLIVCPMNPFWWPVRPSPAMANALQQTGTHAERHFATVFFHDHSEEIARKYETYMSALAAATAQLIREKGAFPVVVGMDRTDRQACGDLTARLGLRHAPIMGVDSRVADVVAILRRADLLVSSRFHALVGSMPAAIPSVGIAMDERISNLFTESGQTSRLLRADDEDLEANLLRAVRGLDPDAVAANARATTAAAIEGMGRMGLAFCDELARLHPDFPLPDRKRTWQAHVTQADTRVLEASA